MSIEMEQALIGCLLDDASVYGPVSEIVADADFEDVRLKQVYGAITEAVRAGEHIDIVTISENLSRQDPKTDWLQVCATTKLSNHAVPNAARYAETIKARGRVRVAKDIVVTALTEAEKDPAKLDDVFKKLAAMDVGTPQRWQHQGLEMMRCAVDDADKAASGENGDGLTTGLGLVDRNMGGLHPTDLIVIGGRPGMGKTSMLVNIAMAQSCPVGFISIEMPASQVGAKMIAAAAWVDYSKFRCGGMTQDDLAKVAAAGEHLRSVDMYCCDKPTATMADVWLTAMEWRRKHGIKLLLIDYLQRIRLPAGANRYEAISEMVMECKMLARQLEIPVVVGSQLNRKLEERQDKRPINADLRESGVIEQEADQIMMLYREQVYNPDEDESSAEVIMTKNRHGKGGVAHVGFNPAAGRFYDRAFVSSAPTGPPPQDYTSRMQ